MHLYPNKCIFRYYCQIQKKYVYLYSLKLSVTTCTPDTGLVGLGALCLYIAQISTNESVGRERAARCHCPKKRDMAWVVFNRHETGRKQPGTGWQPTICSDPIRNACFQYPLQNVLLRCALMKMTLPSCCCPNSRPQGSSSSSSHVILVILVQ